MVGCESPNPPPTTKPITMNATRAARLQQQRIGNHRANCNSDGFFNLLTSDALLETVEALSPAQYRERRYTPTATLSMFLAQALGADRSCQFAVNAFNTQRVVSGLSRCSSRTGAYCRARQRLPLAMVRGLTQQLGSMFDAQVCEHWRWHGRRVRVVDGTTLSMPDTPANQATFPQPSNQKPGVGFPSCRLVGITCLASGALLNAAIGRTKGKGSDEQTLLRSLVDTFEEGDIVLADALFASYFFLAEMNRRGVDILMEQQGARKRSTDFSRGRWLGEHDHEIVLEKPKQRPEWMSEADYADAPATLTVRELKAGGKILVTSLLSTKDAPKERLKTLYQSRWEIELDIRHIKTTMGMDILSSKTPEMIQKEIWVYLLAYNLIRWVMLQSAKLADVLPRTLGFKHCLQLGGIWWQRAQAPSEEQLGELCLLMAEQRVGNRPGRSEPRAVKRRSKPHAWLTEPRAVARQRMRQEGHHQAPK